jgi:hypothetical protein
MSVLLAFCQVKSGRQDSKSAKQLYEEGRDILSDRIHIQSQNSVFARVLNKRALKRFSAAYEADTSFRDAAFYASECALYGKDYQECIYWVMNLKRLDTSKQDLLYYNDVISYCRKQLGQ